MKTKLLLTLPFILSACLSSTESNSNSNLNSSSNTSLSSQNGSSLTLSSNSNSSEIISSSKVQTSSIQAISSSAAKFGTITDERDGKTYKTVVIGKTVWFAENLNYGTMVTSYPLKSGEKYCQNDLEDNCSKYGAFYTWNVAGALDSYCQTSNCSNSFSGICPMGWHLPTDDDYTEVKNVYGGGSSYDAAYSLKLNNTEYPDWNKNYNGGNTSGLSVYPSGMYPNLYQGTMAYFWQGYQDSPVNGYVLILGSTTSQFKQSILNKSNKLNVRCVKNNF